MTSVTIPLTEQQLSHLREKAQRLRTTPEALLAATVEDLLNRPDEEFQQAVAYVLRKNADLYRRLAGLE
jgi:hypothetical protein